MYRLMEEELNNGEINSYVTYGVACKEKGIVIRDISLNKKAVMMFLDKINEFGLSPIHIFDAVEDFLAIEYGE